MDSAKLRSLLEEQGHTVVSDDLNGSGVHPDDRTPAEDSEDSVFYEERHVQRPASPRPDALVDMGRTRSRSTSRRSKSKNAKKKRTRSRASSAVVTNNGSAGRGDVYTPLVNADELEDVNIYGSNGSTGNIVYTTSDYAPAYRRKAEEPEVPPTPGFFGKLAESVGKKETGARPWKPVLVTLAVAGFLCAWYLPVLHKNVPTDLEARASPDIARTLQGLIVQPHSAYFANRITNTTDTSYFFALSHGQHVEVSLRLLGWNITAYPPKSAPFKNFTSTALDFIARVLQLPSKRLTNPSLSPSPIVFDAAAQEQINTSSDPVPAMIFGFDIAKPPVSNVAAQKCLALLVLVGVLWGSEAIPLWVTSLLIPLVVICGRIVLEDTPTNSAKRLLKDLMDPTVVLILGGFSIASALHKLHLDRRIAVFVLSRAAKSVKVFLLVLMLLGMFLSMWVSNVASPVLMVFLVTPMLQTVQDENYAKAICLGIAMSCNIGGMTTPIASPQNAVALQDLEHIDHSVTFLQWVEIAVPFCLVLVVCSWLFLLLWFRPSDQAVRAVPKTVEEPMTWKHWYVIFVTLFTVLLWCTFKFTKSFFGELGTIGLVPVVLLYSADVLSTEDFNQLDWNILMLLGGGAALGDAVQSSGLLTLMADWLLDALDGASVYSIYAVFCVSIMALTNFISHTVGAITTLQTVASVGESIGHSRMLVFAGVLSCSAACCLPVSSFPNVIVYSMKNAKGTGYLTTKDYIQTGIIYQVMFQGLLLSAGWYLFRQAQF